LFVAIHTIDWLQTREVAVNPRWSEMNPILGPHPTIDEVNAYFAVTMAGHYLISRSLNPKWRKRWQYVTIGIGGANVARSVSMGVNLRF
jgi:hypothetical protein